MNYTKPEVVLNGAALGSIQGQHAKGLNLYQDAIDPFPVDANTPTAYEGDE